MSAELSSPARGRSTPALRTSPPVELWLLPVGLAAIMLPTWWDLSRTVWPTDEQGHGPVILLVSVWLLWSARRDLAALPWRSAPLPGWLSFGVGAALFVLGRSQGILTFEMLAQLLLLVATLLLFKGTAALRRVWFPLFFLLFMVPLPEALVAAVTAPLKSAVSAVAGSLLFHLGYPVARAGVVLMIGQYQLLVADACAGLTSMFTLEAIGLLYMQIKGYTSAWRNTLLAVLLVPIAFSANVIRVMVLVLVTYHFGDAAGQGFVHGFAGMLLFVVATLLMMAVDRALGWLLPDRHGRAA